MIDEPLPAWLVSDAHDAETVAQDIKTRVADGLRRADPSTRVTFTDYFNHTYLPDMVLRWPRESANRLLYVRTGSSPQWLADDIVDIAGDKPVVVALSAPLEEFTAGQESNTAVGMGQERLSSVAAETGTSVLSPWAVDEYADQARTSELGRVVTHLALRGGRGLTNRTAAQELGDASSAAFAGASSVDAGATAQGASTFIDRLNADQANQAIRMLHAMWIGFGGSDSAFPVQRTPGKLSAPEIELLMRAVDGAPSSFWRQLGDVSSLQEIEQLDVPGFSSAFNALVAANLTRLSARALTVQYESHGVGEPDRAPYWYVRNAHLAIRAENWTAYVARSKAELPGGNPINGPVSIVELQSRAQRAAVSLSAVDSSAGDLEVTIKSRSRSQLLGNLQFSEMVNVDASSAITTVTATLPGSGTLSVDFTDATAIGVGASRFDLATLCRSSLALLLRTRGDQWDEAEQLLPQDLPETLVDDAAEAVDAPGLFEDDTDPE